MEKFFVEVLELYKIKQKCSQLIVWSKKVCYLMDQIKINDGINVILYIWSILSVKKLHIVILLLINKMRLTRKNIS